MSTSVTLPALGESVTEGTVSRWLKQVGDTVEADEPLLEVSTDKVDTEIPSPTSGVLLEIKAQEDETVEVGAVLAVIGDASEADGSDSGSDGAAAEPEEQPEPSTESANAADEEIAQDDNPPAPTAANVRGGSTGGGGGIEVTLPALGESVTEGTVSRWLKQVGDTVEADEPLLEVSTDKVDTEIPSPMSGVLLEIRVQEDESVEVGAVLAVVGEAGASAPSEPAPEPAPPAEKPQPAPPAEKPKPAPPAEKPKPAPAPAAKIDPQPERHGPVPTSAPAATPVASDSETGYVTPLVRKLAKEHGVDLASVTGTGVGGRVR
ncbi:MAG: dihydrolipoamide acyltransferase, partial [Friedmanniella sp.]|nr:dihydrolipoamide acyltransferase [Friedmanniella sp.]